MKCFKMHGAVVLATLVAAGSASAQVASFTYTQTNSSTGSGSISSFVLNDGSGDITFLPTPMPAAAVVNPAGPGQYVGQQSSQAGAGNEPNTAVGLAWNGSVLATGTRGSDVYTVQVPLRFIPKQTQSPDVNDYTWLVSYGDNAAGGGDAVSSAALRFAMWLSRDDAVDAADTPNTYQRYTQLSHSFVLGQDNFTNSDTTTTAIKDAVDGGDPQGTDAAGRDLAFYWGWRDNGGLNQGAIFIDDFTVGGLLQPDLSTLTLVPEPTGLIGLASLAMFGLARRRARAS